MLDYWSDNVLLVFFVFEVASSPFITLNLHHSDGSTKLQNNKLLLFNSKELLPAMKNRLLFIFIFFILSFSFSCIEKKETAYLPEEFKAYTIFSEGTWWLYREVHTNNIDSIFVFFSNTDVVIDERGSFNQETNFQKIVRRQDTISIRTFPLFKSDNQYKYLFINREENISKFSNESHLLGYPIDSIGQQAFFQTGSFVTEMKQEKAIQNQTYRNTISVSFDGSIAENENPPWKIRSCTFAQNVGMIRIQYYDGTIWELVDYYINN